MRTNIGRVLATTYVGVRQTKTSDLQTRKFADLHFLWQGFGLIVFIPLFTVGESQGMSEANNSDLQIKHNSARFDRWLEILAVEAEDLTPEERWP